MVICRNSDTKVPLSLRGARFLAYASEQAPQSREGARGLPRISHLSLQVPIYRDEAISVGQGDCREHS
jgi:hypothetical protein